MVSPAPAYDVAVRGWAAALRAGSTTTWSQYRDGAVVAGTGTITTTATGVLPGAAQLEVLRRLALLHRDAPLPDFELLADRVLASAGRGRGMVDPPLSWPAAAPRFGPPPVEPEAIPANELVRAATGVLVPLLTETGPVPVATRSGRRWWWRRRFLVGGSPLAAAAVRSSLLAAGWVEGGRRPLCLVVGRDLETMMGEHWLAAALDGSERRWRPLWRRARTHDVLPVPLRLDRIAARWAARKRARVHVVLGADARAIAAAVGMITQVEIAIAEPVLVWQEADLLRRLNPFLVVVGGDDGRRAAVEGPWHGALAALAGPAVPEPLGAPRGFLPWAVAEARRTAAALEAGAGRGDYAVHGDPALLVPDPSREIGRLPDASVVAGLGIAVIAQLWRDRARKDVR
jgi:hypothetical protein